MAYYAVRVVIAMTPFATFCVFGILKFIIRYLDRKEMEARQCLAEIPWCLRKPSSPRIRIGIAYFPKRAHKGMEIFASSSALLLHSLYIILFSFCYIFGAYIFCYIF